MSETAPATAGVGTKPARWWIAVTLLAGALGATGSVAAFGSETYTITPLRVKLSARPALLGSSQLSVEPVPGALPWHSEAGTHNSPITFRMTVVGVGVHDEFASGSLAGLGEAAEDDAVLRAVVNRDPHALVQHIRFSEEGKEAIADFGMRLGLLAVSGGAVGGLAVSFGRWRRLLGGALAGILAIGIVGALLHQTFDAEEFRNARVVVEDQGAAPRAARAWDG